MRFIIACGGTGGHVYPGVATGQVLQTGGHDVHIWLAGKSIEQKSIQSWDGPVSVIATDWDQSRSPLAFLRTGLRLARAWLGCRRQLRRLRPDALLAMGSRASLIPVAAARSLKIPVVLHESNVMPGRAVVLLSRFFRVTVALGFAETADLLPGRTTIVTGFPLRALASREPLAGLPPGEAPVILVMGGSQGSTRVNQLACDALIRLHRGGMPLRVIHLAGVKQEAAIRSSYAAAGVPAVVFGYLQNMAAAYAAASVALSRAGAASCAELALFGVPALYIPYPYAGNHQRLNALAMEKAGAALTRSQDALSVEGLAERLGHLLTDHAARTRMREAALNAATPDAARRLADILIASAPPPAAP